MMLDAVTLIFIGQALPGCCEPRILCFIRALKLAQCSGQRLLGLILILTLAAANPVRRCMLPKCREITVRSSEVRDIYVTAFNINRVTIIGDPKGVRIHSLKGALCSK